MFKQDVEPSLLWIGFAQLELVFHAAVRFVRKTHGNAIIGLFLNILQTVITIVVFYIMFHVLGLRSNAVRGDFILYIMSGIFLFMTHNKAMGAVFKADGPTSPMMKHGPMNPLVAIASAALGSLYLQLLSMGFVLFVYHVAFQPITIDRPVQAMGMVLMSWFVGCAIGMVFRAAKPWHPTGVGIAQMIYGRANMIASGKMFLANTLTPKLLFYFSWNPLFHTIDQARGFTFINYNPHFSSVSYPFYVALACMMIGLIGEFYTGQHASLSWQAGR